jgi:hypothetical protein
MRVDATGRRSNLTCRNTTCRYRAGRNRQARGQGFRSPKLNAFSKSRLAERAKRGTTGHADFFLAKILQDHSSESLLILISVSRTASVCVVVPSSCLRRSEVFHDSAVTPCVSATGSQFVSVGFHASSQAGEGAGRSVLPAGLGIAREPKRSRGSVFGVHAVCSASVGGAEPRADTAG